ncbi:pentatricopeptide repeat-containing protein At1g31790 [Rutidosis leptorrhynchoides]|uniref:pentatricopeptide repeat-containing protein At1g31790 n=1 Tax=Rutidosis leptorrhynchoides TaxID=125765 RepID=UPI003A98E2C0
MEITSKLIQVKSIVSPSTSQNPKSHHRRNQSFPGKSSSPSSTIQLPLHRPHRKILQPVKPPPKTPISTTTTTTATTPSDILRLLDCLGFPVPEALYISLINECTHFRDINEAVLIHNHLTRNHRNRARLALVNRVLIMFVTCRCMLNSRQVFDEMTKRDFNSWAIMIAGYTDIGEYDEVIELFICSDFQYIMYSCRSFPISWVLVCVLKACADTKNLKLGEQIHGWLIKLGFTNDLFVSSSLISFYGKIGCLEGGELVFDQMSCRRNVVVWTARIINKCKEEKFHEVLEVFKEMGKEGIRKNSFTISGVLSACAKISDDGSCGEQVHANAIKLGLASKSYVQCGLVHMYGKFGLINDAKKVFDMNESRRNRACWNAMLTSFVQHGCLIEAIKFLYQMKAAGVQPQELWLNKLRSLCGSEIFEFK